MATASQFSHLPLSQSGPLKTSSTGRAMLFNPILNKGTAFTPKERRTFDLLGLLPTNVQTLDEQISRAYDQYSSCGSDISKNTFMTSMAEQNTVLYYALLARHLKEMFSVIYTPTEGEAIENYSRLFRRQQGCFLNIGDGEQVEERLGRFKKESEMGNGVDYLVVSDGEEILGIGDQGIGGILISVAKLVLMTACAGVDPNRVLPVVLDVGTDRESLLNDELYLGLKQKRTRGKEYDEFVDKFVKAAGKHFPNAVVHFEDFGVTNARKILDRYRGEIACFNDDIQGTGCVTLAAVMAALKVSKVPLDKMKMVVFGSGSAGCGIAEQVAAGIAADRGKSIEEARAQIWCIDKSGLLIDDQDSISIAQKPFARKSAEWKDEDISFASVMKKVKPNVLIGTSTKPGAFTQEIVEEMAKNVERPIIFPLSNPTRLHEAKPNDLYQWTKGKALLATGSPFPPVEYEGKRFEVAECNNAMVFPGIGLGTILSRAKLLSDKMLVAAVKALAETAPTVEADGEATKGLLPDVEVVRDVSVKVAVAVVRAAVEEKLATAKGIPMDERDCEDWVRAQMWESVYREFEKV